MPETLTCKVNFRFVDATTSIARRKTLSATAPATGDPRRIYATRVYAEVQSMAESHYADRHFPQGWVVKDREGFKCAFDNALEFWDIVATNDMNRPIDIIVPASAGVSAQDARDSTVTDTTATAEPSAPTAAEIGTETTAGTIVENDTGAAAEDQGPSSVAPPPPSPFVSDYTEVVHHGVECDTCGVNPIVGPRFKCAICPDFDLCQSCDALDNHGDHPVVKMRTTQCVSVEARLGSLRSRCGPIQRRLAGLTRQFARACSVSVRPAANNNDSNEDVDEQHPGNDDEEEGSSHGHDQSPNPVAELMKTEEQVQTQAQTQAQIQTQTQVQQQQQPQQELPASAAASLSSSSSMSQSAASPLEDSWSALKDDLHARMGLTASVLETSGASEPRPSPALGPLAGGVASGGAPATLTTTPAGSSAARAFHATFIDDVTIADGERLPAGVPFTKVWLLRNEGEKQWPAGTTLKLVGGEPMGAMGDEIEVPRAAPGEVVRVAADLVAPREPGRYVSYYRMSNSGLLWGNRIWVEIMSVEPTAPGGGSGVVASPAAASVASTIVAASAVPLDALLCESENGSHASEVLVDYADAVEEVQPQEQVAQVQAEDDSEGATAMTPPLNQGTTLTPEQANVVAVLAEMGFTDTERATAAAITCNCDISAAIDAMMADN